ncbi:MAG TPA: N-6 DNA methylase [Lacunisphaera sp.]|nr:N-6 DNA methylase [Lacunisphaera sp.]
MQVLEEPSWDVWFHKGDGTQLLWSHQRGSLDAFFKAHKRQITPEAIYRAKTLGRLQSNQQLSFVDVGALEMVEAEAGDQLCGLIERMMRITSDRLSLGSHQSLDADTAQWLVQANFWLLAARLLQDKEVPNFKRLDLSDIDTTFDRVTRHYGASITDYRLSVARRSALRLAATELQNHGSLSLVSTETLAHVYENALITPQTRKELGTHSTPSWLVDYIFSRLAPWIEEMPSSRRHVYEPTCGHAPFLLGALRLLAAGKACTKLSDADRHVWLKQRLRGSEIDDFAREVARLSLTLADIPNPNGWILDEGDLFQGDQLVTRIHEADIIVANPPFEAKTLGTLVDSVDGDLSHVSRAAELLRRITVGARPGSLVGLVVPQTLLDSSKLSGLRATLHTNFEWQEILRLPDKDVFKIADVEAAVLIGRCLPSSSRHSPRTKTVFKSVVENDVPRFVKDGTATVTQERMLPVTGAASEHSMLLPDLADIWDHLKGVGTLEEIAEVGQGFSFKSEEDPTFPAGQTQISETKQVGFALGFYDFPKNRLTHEHPPLVWLNRNRAAIRRPHSGYADGIPQIVFNYAPIKRGPWRIAAYMDPEGHPATSRFLVVRPHSHNLFFLWSILNSPVANAFSKAFGGKRDILAGTMRQLPLPRPSDTQLREIESAARAYFEKCTNVRSVKVGKRRNLALIPDAPELPGLSGIGSECADSTDSIQLRELHWRMDAAVLRLYNLPSEFERQLLDYFRGHRRERVPFDQTEYIPEQVSEVRTLGQFLNVTADWEANNERRAELIDREYEGRITKAELAELEPLQKLASLRRDVLAPLPLADLEAEIERLKREGKWE